MRKKNINRLRIEMECYATTFQSVTFTPFSMPMGGNNSVWLVKFFEPFDGLTLTNDNLCFYLYTLYPIWIFRSLCVSARKFIAPMCVLINSFKSISYHITSNIIDYTKTVLMVRFTTQKSNKFNDKTKETRCKWAKNNFYSFLSFEMSLAHYFHWVNLLYGFIYVKFLIVNRIVTLLCVKKN